MRATSDRPISWIRSRRQVRRVAVLTWKAYQAGAVRERRQADGGRGQRAGIRRG